MKHEKPFLLCPLSTKTMASNHRDSSLISRIIFREVQPTDIPRCHQIESASYPEDEAGSKSALQYRQHHAARFFRCAFLVGDSSRSSVSGRTGTSSSISYQGQSMNPAATLCGTIIGFVCATRCKSFTAESLKTHDGTGKILAIHSVVVEERYRNSGVASAMLEDYVTAMERLNNKGALKVKLDKVVLMAKKNLLAFYVRNGFMAMGVSPIVHGKEQWFELERILSSSEGSDAKTHQCFIIDSFADAEKQGSGNPAGVVVLDFPPGEQSDNESANNDSDSDESLDKMEESTGQDRGVEWMSTVAKEFNLSETAFIWPLPHHKTLDNGCLCPPQQNSAKVPAYAIRYYTRSGVEVDLCGHATLAAAFCMLHPKKLEDPKQNHKITFIANNDDLQAELLVPPANSQSTTSISNNASRIAMNFPWKNVTPVSPAGKEGKEDVLSMLSLAFTGAPASGHAKLFKFQKDQSRSFFTKHVLHIGTTDGKEDLLIELTEEGFDSLLGLKVDYGAFSQFQGYSRGVVICCCASASNAESKQPTSSLDFRSRFFGPKVGIDEDPVTGSAHCSLGPYFGNKLGKKVVVGRQESERGGLVECILKPEEGRVCIVGTAVMTVSGQLSISI